MEKIVNKSFKQLLRESFKSADTEEWLDVYFTRPIGLAFALLWARLHVTPNVVTILSMFLGAGAGFCFYHTALAWNLWGVALLMLANFCDSTDGQLARLTNHKTLVGRMLDGFASDVWFFCCYLAIALRLWNEPLPLAGGTVWGIGGFLLCGYAGFYWHSKQCALADYYRQIHLYFLKGREGSELDSYASQQRIYDQLPRHGAFWDHVFYYFYKGYCKKQERLTPQFQQFFARIKALYPEASDMPQGLREAFRQQSKPLMPFTNVLTHNTRAIVLFASCLLNEPWVYPLFEVTVLAALYYYMHHRHERLCRDFPVPAFRLSDCKGMLFDYGGTIDTQGRHWGRVLWQAYQHCGVPVTEEQFRQAYVEAERTLGHNPIVKPDYTFRQTLEAKVRLQMDHLGLQGYADGVVEEAYRQARETTARSREVLMALQQHMPLGLVSNFYGNMAVVLREFGLDNIFQCVIESAAVGIRKPDPGIFQMGVEALGVEPGQVAVVGDSLDKDIVPAHRLGCKTIWLRGESWVSGAQDDTLPDQTITSLSQLWI